MGVCVGGFDGLEEVAAYLARRSYQEMEVWASLHGYLSLAHITKQASTSHTYKHALTHGGMQAQRYINTR